MMNPFEDTYLNEYNDFTFDYIFAPNKESTDYYATYEQFKSYYNEYAPLIKTNILLDEEHIRRTFYLLYAEYGNSKACGSGYDLTQWLLRLFNIMIDKGEVWQVKDNIQNELKSLDLNSNILLEGDKTILNIALHPNQPPSTSTLTELDHINQQNTSNKKRGKLEGLSTLWGILRTDLNKIYIRQFSVLFSKIAMNDAYNHTYTSVEIS